MGFFSFPNTGDLAGVNTKLDGIKTETDKITTAEILGPADTDYSLSWHIGLMHAQKYSRERWIGLHATPNGTINRGQDISLGNNNAPFTLTSGATNGTFGAWVQMFGTGDGPYSMPDNTMFLAYGFAITDVNSTAPYIIEAAAGPDLATAEYIGLVLKRSVHVYYKANSTATSSSVETITGGLVPFGYGVWARALTIGAASKTISLYYGINEMKGNGGGLRY